MRIKTGIATLVLAVSMSQAARADKLPEQTAEYSATRSIEAKGHKMQQKIHASKGRERTETEIGGMPMITILRPDKKLVWMVIPQLSMYRAMSMDDSKGNPAAPPEGVEITALGKETVSGVETTQYRMLEKTDSGQTIERGLIWLSADGILMKMEAWAGDGSEKAQVRLILTDLKRGRQDPSLFELPEGVREAPPGLAKMFGR